jgi:AefR-like transcriptional repressor, C-terminal domain
LPAAVSTFTGFQYRVLIAEAQRFPELGRLLTERGKLPYLTRVSGYLTAESSAGHLNVSDATRAARQFLAMISDQVFWPAMLRADFKVLPAQSTGRTTDSVAGLTAAGTRLILRFINLERASVKIFAVQRLHGSRGIRAGHLHESETARLTGITIIDQRELLNGSVRSEKVANGVFGCRKGKVTDI